MHSLFLLGLIIVCHLFSISAQTIYTNTTAITPIVSCRSEEVHIISVYEGICHSGHQKQPSTLIHLEIVDVAQYSALYLNSYEGIVWNLTGAHLSRISRIELRGYYPMGLFNIPPGALVHYKSAYTSYGNLAFSTVLSATNAARVATSYVSETFSGYYRAIRNNPAAVTQYTQTNFKSDCYGYPNPSNPSYILPTIPAGAGYNDTQERTWNTCNIMQQPAPCSMDHIINNGYVNYTTLVSTNPNNVTTSTTNATFSCNPGYHLVPTTSTWATCLSSNDNPTYSKSIPSCSINTCSSSSLLSLLSSNMSLNATSSSTINAGNDIRIHCNNGYMYVNTTLAITNTWNVTCGLDGTWIWNPEAVNATCIVIPTSPPTTPTTSAPTTTSPTTPTPTPTPIPCSNETEEVHIVSIYEGVCHTGSGIQPNTLVNLEIVDVAESSSLYLNSYEGITWNLFGAHLNRIKRIELRSYNAMGLFNAPNHTQITYKRDYEKWDLPIPNVLALSGAKRIGTSYVSYTLGIYIAIRNNVNISSTMNESNFTRQCFGISNPDAPSQIIPVLPTGAMGYNSTETRVLQVCEQPTSKPATSQPTSTSSPSSTGSNITPTPTPTPTTTTTPTPTPTPTATSCTTTNEVHIISVYEGVCHTGHRIQPNTLVNLEIVDVAESSSLYLNSYEGITWNLFGAHLARISRIELRSYNAMGLFNAPTHTQITYKQDYRAYDEPINTTSLIGTGAQRVGTIYTSYSIGIYYAIRNNINIPSTKSTSNFTRQCYGIPDPSAPSYTIPVLPTGAMGYNSTKTRTLQECGFPSSNPGTNKPTSPSGTGENITPTPNSTPTPTSPPIPLSSTAASNACYQSHIPIPLIGSISLFMMIFQLL